jgi:hypothetical protein
MRTKEQQIEFLQKHLDWLADEIDASIAEDGEIDNKYAVCMRLTHAQTSALLHLIKKGQTNVEYKNKLG